MNHAGNPYNERYKTDPDNIINISISDIPEGAQRIIINKIGLDKFNELLNIHGVSIRKIQVKKEWTLQNCMESAAPFNNVKTWQLAFPSAYQIALRRQHKGLGWLDRCREHMSGRSTNRHQPYAHITDEMIIESAKKSGSRNEWMKSDPIIFKIYTGRHYGNKHKNIPYITIKFKNSKKTWNETINSINTVILVENEKTKYGYELYKSNVEKGNYKDWKDWKDSNPVEYKKVAKIGYLKKLLTEVFGDYKQAIRYDDNIRRLRKFKDGMKSAFNHKTVTEWKLTNKKLYVTLYACELVEDVISRSNLIDDRSKKNVIVSTDECMRISSLYENKSLTKLKKEQPTVYRSIIRLKTEDPTSYKKCINNFSIVHWTEQMYFDYAKKIADFSKFRYTSRGVLARKLGLIPRISKEIFGQDPPKERIIWTRESAKMMANKFHSKIEWLKNSCGSYQWASKQGEEFFNECCANFKPKFTWTPLTLLEDARKHDTLAKWRESNTSGQKIAKRMGILKECKAHFIKQPRWKYTTARWNKESIIKNAQPWKSTDEWLANGGSGAYAAAKRLYCLREARAHFIKNNKWDNETAILESTRICNTKTEWIKKYYGAYKAAKKIGEDFFNKCISNFPTKAKLLSERFLKWTDDKLESDAKLYPTREDWRKNSPSAYTISIKRGIFERCVGHMPVPHRNTDEYLSMMAKKFKSPDEWQKTDGASYAASCKKGKEFLLKVRTHMGPTNKEKLDSLTDQDIVDNAKNHTTLKSWIYSGPNGKVSRIYRLSKKRNVFEIATEHMEKIYFGANKK